MNSVTPTVTPKPESWLFKVVKKTTCRFKRDWGTDDTDRVLTNKDRAGQQGAKKEDSGRSVIRTRDPLRVKQVSGASNDLEQANLQDGEKPVTPTVTPESQIDRKKALLEALRGVDRETLLEVLAEVLTDAKNPSLPG